jgi:hypothetical protein
MSSSFTTRIATRFAPLDFTNVVGFPNVVHVMESWVDYIPKFKEDVNDNPAYHLFEINKLMHQLNIHHEDVLMKLFMFSLGEDARHWYKSLPLSSILSLKEFHVAFNKFFVITYSYQKVAG